MGVSTGAWFDSPYTRLIMDMESVSSIENYIEAGDFAGLADHCEETEITVSLCCGTLSI